MEGMRHAGSGCETFHALVFSSAGKAIATGEPVTLAVDE